MSAVIAEPIPFIRPMRVDDVSDVMAVERASYSHPWTDGILRDCLRVGYSCWVCEKGEVLIAHLVMSIAAGEAHLLNLCVAPGSQSHGIGRRMLRRALRIAGDRAADTMFLEVRESNSVARHLYESEGFGEVGRRRGYYPHGVDAREDAIVYAKALI
jgi:ribosomal-protein-alanine N-acetyltransferase